MAFRMINTRFWDDSYVVSLDPIEKLLFLYFMTNALTNICGVYEISVRRVELDTGIDRKMIKEILKKFSEDKRIFYISGWLCIKNFTKHQKVSNPSVKIGIDRALSEVPDNVKMEFERQTVTGCDRLGTECIDAGTTKLNLTKPNLTKANDKIVPSYTDKDVELTKLLYKQVKENFSFLVDRKTEKQWLSDYQEMNKINRLDGIGYDTIEFIIDWSQNDRFWKGNIRSVNKLRKQMDNLLVQAKGQMDKNKIVNI